MDGIFLEAVVGVDSRRKSSGICTMCCPEQFSLQSEAKIDVFAPWPESDDNVHLGEYGTVISIAAHDHDHYCGDFFGRYDTTTPFAEQGKGVYKGVYKGVPKVMALESQRPPLGGRFCTPRSNILLYVFFIFQ